VAVTISGHVVTGVVYVSGISYSQWTPAVQAAFTKGLAADVVPDTDNVFITNLADASVAANWATNSPGTPVPAGARGALVSYMIDGYSCLIAAVPSACTDAGFSIALSDSAILNNVGAGSATAASVVSLLPSAAMTDVSPGTGFPQISAAVNVGINQDWAPGLLAANATSTTAIMQAAFDSAINSGVLAQNLAGLGVSVAAPTNAQTARAQKALDSASSCPTLSLTDLQAAFAAAAAGLATSSSNSALTNSYKSAMIAFVVLFGVSLVVAFGLLVREVASLKSLTRSLTVAQSFGGDDMPPPPMKTGSAFKVHPASDDA